MGLSAAQTPASWPGLGIDIVPSDYLIIKARDPCLSTICSDLDTDVLTLGGKAGVPLVIIASALVTISVTGSSNAFAQRASVAKEIPSLPFSIREMYVRGRPAR